MLDVHVVIVDWPSHESALREIRTAVFVEEQNIPAELEFDADDPQAIHLLALNSAGQAVGCARLLESGLIGRVAVVQAHRNQGLGTLILEAAVSQAQQNKLTRVFLNAQSNAEGFYHKLDFRRTGGEFLEAGIPHITMERTLPIPFDTSGLKKSAIVRKTPIVNPRQAAEPRTSALREFADDGTAIEQLHSVLRSARRTIRLYSPELDHTLFDTQDCVDLLSEFVRSAAGAQVEILIKNSALIVTRGHLLVELSRRLDEKLVIRRLPDSLKGDRQSWLVVDTCALWVQSEPEDYSGWSDTWNPVQAERFDKRFTQFWDRSGPDPELRVLRL